MVFVVSRAAGYLADCRGTVVLEERCHFGGWTHLPPSPIWISVDFGRFSTGATRCWKPGPANGLPEKTPYKTLDLLPSIGTSFQGPWQTGLDPSHPPKIRTLSPTPPVARSVGLDLPAPPPAVSRRPPGARKRRGVGHRAPRVSANRQPIAWPVRPSPGDESFARCEGKGKGGLSH